MTFNFNFDFDRIQMRQNEQRQQNKSCETSDFIRLDLSSMILWAMQKCRFWNNNNGNKIRIHNGLKCANRFLVRCGTKIRFIIVVKNGKSEMPLRLCYRHFNNFSFGNFSKLCTRKWMLCRFCDLPCMDSFVYFDWTIHTFVNVLQMWVICQREEERKNH